jgi:hypothetical protein
MRSPMPPLGSARPLPRATVGSTGCYRHRTNGRRSLRKPLSPVGSTTRRDLGLALRAARRVAGPTARGAADQLGHSRISMTQDNYFDRKAPNPAATQALQQAFKDPDLL